MTGLTRPIRLGPFLGILFGVMVLACALTLALPYRADIRYHAFGDTIFADLGTIHDRIVLDDTPIDILLVGSSRTARGIDAALLETALAARGMPLRVANISVPASGLDLRDTKIRLALAHHPEIRLIIFGVVEALPRDGHQAFADLASPAEILTAPWLINRNLPETIAKLPYRQLRDRLAAVVPVAFDGPAADDAGPHSEPGSDADAVPPPDAEGPAGLAYADTALHAADLAAESRRRNRQITPPVLPRALAGLEFGVSRAYIHRIKDMAEAHDARLVFSFLPFYDGHAEPLDADWLQAQAPLWSASFLKDDPRNYIDAAHANRNGTALIVPWMADRIVALLEDTP